MLFIFSRPGLLIGKVSDEDLCRGCSLVVLGRGSAGIVKDAIVQLEEER
jgi:hypothetical protein